MSSVAVVSSSYPRWPGDFAGHFVECEARELMRAGHRVTVFAAGASAGDSMEHGLRVLRLPDGGASGAPGLLPRLKERPLRSLGLAGWLFAVERALRREGPFARIIAHFLLPVAPLFLSSPALRDAAFEIVVHGSELRLFSKLPGPLARVLLARLSAADVSFRCVSSELLGELERIAGRSLSPRAQVRPASIDVSSAPSRELARRQLGIPEQQRVAVVVGRLIPSKRVQDALAAASLLTDLELIVVGDGPELASLRSEFPAVRFAGALPRPQTLAYIVAADVLLSASRLEGAPTAIREARALRVPVVSSAAGDLLRWARADEALWVVADC